MAPRLTPAQMQEIIDKLADRKWRLSHLYRIIDGAGNEVPFRPNAQQRQFLDEVHNLNIILKARQLGFTTFCCLIYLDACLFEPNTRAGVIAHKLDDAKVIFRDKIKFPYDRLEPEIRALVPTATQDSADTLTFSNNSSIRVSTSMRSGTLQYLHVSEFGKICAQSPEKAREIVTGSFNTLAPGQFATIESTAEGQEGAFYRMTQLARENRAAGRTPTKLDWKFHFFPWYEERRYRLAKTYVTITADDQVYFQKLEAEGIKLDDEQKAWYVKKAESQGGDMRREFPSTPDEAFEQALEGAYFSSEMYAAAKQGRIGAYPYQPGYPVNTFWDLGRNDLNVIWVHQVVKGHHRFVGYYENSGEHISHYVAWVREWARDRNATFGDHYLPHDGDRQSLWLEHGTMGVLETLKFRPKIVERPVSKMEAIAMARTAFAKCQFDEEGCDTGLKRLRAYRKEWDGDRGVYKDRPMHDEASHGADGFLTFACSDVERMIEAVSEEKKRRYFDRRPTQRGSAWAS
jgi:hypothetical protein